MEKELTRTIIKDQKVLFGEQELTNLIRTLIRVYRFRCGNQTPIAIVMPNVTEVDGVEVEFSTTIEPTPEPEVIKEEEKDD